ncbi:MAG: MlaC/ttg2D family ABC transporter substrate-binding protein [Gammaproteobacteria bacterium]
MMNTLLRVPTLILVLLVWMSAPLAAEKGPAEVIQEVSSLMLEAIDGRRDELKGDTEELQRIVDEILLPRFDLRYSGGLVMGKYWRKANEEQRERFILALYHSLVRTYSNSLLDYKGDELEVLPVTDDLAEGKVIVETRVALDTGVVAPVNYRMRKGSDGSWKAYDVIIEGISYVTNYRKQYSSEFRAKGIDQVIEELESKGAAPVEATTAAVEDSG